MGIEIFDYTKSDRAERLWAILKPRLKPEMKVLDVGCGNAPIAHYAFRDFPGISWTGFDNHGPMIEEMKKAYPSGRWMYAHYPDVFDKSLRAAFDAVIHIGVDKEEFSPICNFHKEIVKAEHKPAVVLLEAGYAEEYQGPYNAYCKAMAAYLMSGKYDIAASGRFPFDVAGHHLKERIWSVLRRKAEAPAC
jgi:SAM-dependent methyltransferase